MKELRVITPPSATRSLRDMPNDSVCSRYMYITRIQHILTGLMAVLIVFFFKKKRNMLTDSKMNCVCWWTEPPSSSSFSSGQQHHWLMMSWLEQTLTRDFDDLQAYATAALYAASARSRQSLCSTIGFGYPFFFALSPAPRLYGS